jgi:hypothetical protein
MSGLRRESEILADQIAGSAAFLRDRQKRLGSLMAESESGHQREVAHLCVAEVREKLTPNGIPVTSGICATHQKASDRIYNYCFCTAHRW